MFISMRITLFVNYIIFIYVPVCLYLYLFVSYVLTFDLYLLLSIMHNKYLFVELFINYPYLFCSINLIKKFKLVTSVKPLNKHLEILI